MFYPCNAKQETRLFVLLIHAPSGESTNAPRTPSRTCLRKIRGIIHFSHQIISSRPLPSSETVGRVFFQCSPARHLRYRENRNGRLWLKVRKQEVRAELEF